MTDDAMIGPVEAPDLHLMTYNVRRPLPHLRRRHPDRWERRAPLLQALLAREQPTLLGTQETTSGQSEVVLEGLGAAYHTIGRDRSPGDDERNPVYWDTRRLRLVEWEQRALSDTPDVAGSRGWGNLWPRIVVSAGFEDLATGIKFLFLNTHLDPVSPRSRMRSARVLRDLAAGSARPVIITGDFNTDSGSKAHRVLTDAVLRDLWHTSPQRLSADWGTFPNYRRPRRGTQQIDWILATREIATVRTGINAARNGGWPSDHMPVQAVVRMTRQ